ncbi:MAG: sigma-70 family RNA polymerase sigma factor [Phycisphaerales bacterium]|nr:MAG: sigma-70 family RNA polymerase sigma factor [Phycisphaerales bacterium]
MTNYTDEELMSFVRDQDVSAFEELFGRYERRVFAFFCRLIWNAEEAKDCTQETFLRLWRGRAGYTPKGRFSTYIFQIAKNHFLHERQKQKSRITMIHTTRANTLPRADESALPDSTCSEAVAHEVEAAISKAVASLPEAHRLVYVLSEQQRLSYKEIADVLGCPVGTVSSRKVEAIRKLRKLLEPLRDEFLGEEPHNREKNK